jgi:hypothetical protein
VSPTCRAWRRSQPYLLMMERVAGIEPASQAWKASALPLRKTEKPLIFRDFIWGGWADGAGNAADVTQRLPQSRTSLVRGVTASRHLRLGRHIIATFRLAGPSISQNIEDSKDLYVLKACPSADDPKLRLIHFGSERHGKKRLPSRSGHRKDEVPARLSGASGLIRIWPPSAKLYEGNALVVHGEPSNPGGLNNALCNHLLRRQRRHRQISQFSK